MLSRGEYHQKAFIIWSLLQSGDIRVSRGSIRKRHSALPSPKLSTAKEELCKWTVFFSLFIRNRQEILLLSYSGDLIVPLKLFQFWSNCVTDTRGPSYHTMQGTWYTCVDTTDYSRSSSLDLLAVTLKLQNFSN